MSQTTPIGRPTVAFVGASWASLLVGCTAYLIGLWNAQMALNEKGYYLSVLMFGLFSAVSAQKAVRDRAEAIPVSALYFALCWVSVLSALLLLTVGLWNAGLAPSEKGFYAMAFTLSMFAAVTVQKNVRDLAAADASGTRQDTGAAADPGTVPWGAGGPLRD